MSFDRIDGEPNHGPEPLGPPKTKLAELLGAALANTGAVKVDDRRFTDKAALDPEAVRSLPLNHPALMENRTLFPSTVVDVTDEFSDRLLVSGKNNRKLGERITKGKFKGYALYGLSLEERATCPTDCGVRAFCYGNGMQMARRHRITDIDLFSTFLEDEIRTILADPIDGLLVRLHVLGDFPSVEYVAMWADLLGEHDRLACYGYTHWRGEIGDAIESVKSRYPDRFRIRWSSDKSVADGAVVVTHVPTKKRIAEGLVCPAQTDATASCSTCGLCWEGHAKHDSIVFIKHGPKSLQALAESMTAAPKTAPAKQEPTRDTIAPAPASSENVRPVTALTVPQKRDAVLSSPPEMRLVAPSELKIESAYQRDLSGKSMKLIRKIVIGWDWAKFKPPVVAETAGGLFIIDGQHTAIAAASHPEIKQIPVMVVPAVRIERRAEAFVAHNRDRLTMTPAQVFYGEVASGNKEAKAALQAVMRAGATIPRLPVQKNYAKPGQITAITELRSIVAAHGADTLERIIRIAVLSKVAPITKTVLGALRILLTDPKHSAIATVHDSRIASAIASIKNIEAVSAHAASDTGQGRTRACASLLVATLNEGKAA